ncbi:unnamed protein product [Rhizophagus irregularis]|nr:unnamed protein product [Rhizophagus irregularis]
MYFRELLRNDFVNNLGRQNQKKKVIGVLIEILIMWLITLDSAMVTVPKYIKTNIFLYIDYNAINLYPFLFLIL